MSLVAGIGALGSAIVSYAVTNATLKAEAANIKERLDYSDNQKDQIVRDIVEIKVGIARIEGIVSGRDAGKNTARR